MIDRLTAAHAFLRQLIADGWEYPDASAKAATTFNVSTEDLAKEYDDADNFH